MGVTIDNLQIEIQSSSTNAAEGIKTLAKSLEELKKHGSFKTVANNLNNLSAALKSLPNVHGASNALRTLANSIQRLQEVGTVSKLTNSLKKLPEALTALEKIDLDKAGTNIEKVVRAVSPLSEVKTSGFGSMVNGLAKLKTVTESLDDDTISAFANKVELLNTKLGPLSDKMASIKTGFSTINSKARTAASGVKEFGEGVDTSTLNMSSFIDVVRTAVDLVQQLIVKVSEYIHVASQWDGIKYQFGNAFGDQADIYYEKITEITEALNINKQVFMENSAMAASMLIGFGVDKADAREMGLGYTQLAYDIWAAFNNVYEKLDGAEGAMAAVRSAIAGEVEPIRRAGFTIIESQLEQTAANHGLEISIENATEAQKSYLRYLELVDQAQRKGVVGTYAREMNTAEGVMRTFSQQLKSLAQAFGSLFLPVLVKVMPYLQAFIELLTEAVHWMANLFGIEIQDIGDTWNDYSSGVSDAVDNTNGVTGALDDATQAAKELKNASIGIDELNVISKPSASGSGSGSGGSGSGGSAGGGFDGLDIESLWDQSIFDSVQSKVDEIKTKLKGMFDEWRPTLEVIGAALAGWSIAGLLGQLGDALNLSSKFEGTVTNIRKLASSAIIIALQFKLMGDAFSDFMGEDGTILDYIEGVLIGAASTYLLYKQWGVGGLAIGLGVTAAVSLKTVMDEGGVTDMESAVVALTGLAAGIGAIASALKGLSTAWAAFKGSAIVTWFTEFIVAAKAMAPEVGWMAALFPKLSGALSSIGTAISSVGTAIASAGIGTVAAAIAAVVVLVGSAVYFVYENWEKLKQAVKDFFNENITPKLDEIKKHFDNIKEALEPLRVSLEPIITGFKEFIEGINWEGFKKVFGEIVEWIGAYVVAMSGLVTAGLFPAVVGLFENFVQSISGYIQLFAGAIDFWIALFTGGDVEAACKKMLDGIKDLFGGLLGLVIDPIVDFYNGVVSWFTELWDVLVGHSIVPDMIDDIVDCFAGLPGRVFSSIESFVTGTIEKFQGLWDNLTSAITGWWENTIVSFFSKTIPNFFTEVLPTFFAELPNKFVEIGENIVNGIVSGITSAATWVKETIVGWCDTFVGWFKDTFGIHSPSTVFAEIGKNIIEGLLLFLDVNALKEKIAEMWNNLKTWWDSKPTLSDYTPNIGSMTDKVSSVWSAVKTWWGNKPKLSDYTPNIGSIKDKLSSAWTSAVNWWNGKKTALKSYTPSIGSIYEKLKERWDNARTWWNDKKTKAKEYTPSIGSIYEKLYDRWKNARDWWNNKKGSMSYTPSIGSITDKLKSAWNSAKSWWSKNVKLSIPSLSFKVTYSTPSTKTMKAIMNALDLPGWPKLSFAANGGLFDQGSMIWAGERGPEIVANAAGGKTGVMNVQQMQDAVYEGVYAAVVAAMRGGNGGGSQEIRVYLDGKEISASVKKHQHESGATIMGNEVYSY